MKNRKSKRCTKINASIITRVSFIEKNQATQMIEWLFLRQNIVYLYAKICIITCYIK